MPSTEGVTGSDKQSDNEILELIARRSMGLKLSTLLIPGLALIGIAIWAKVSGNEDSEFCEHLGCIPSGAGYGPIFLVLGLIGLNGVIRDHLEIRRLQQQDSAVAPYRTSQSRLSSGDPEAKPLLNLIEASSPSSA